VVKNRLLKSYERIIIKEIRKVKIGINNLTVYGFRKINKWRNT